MRSIQRLFIITITIIMLVAVPLNSMATYSEETLMFEPEQFRQYIRMVLTRFELITSRDWVNNEDVVELLMLTAAQESHLGRYLMQIRGPARGVFQIEPRTLEDLIQNYLAYRDDLAAAIRAVHGKGMDSEINLTGNLAFQICVARLIYRRAPAALPDKDDVESMAKYWKKYWNTELGKGTVEEAIDNYIRYAVEG